MTSFRKSAKRAVEAALVIGGGCAVARHRRSEQLLVLAYHNIVPTGLGAAGDRSLHLKQSAFADQLDLLLETHDIIGLDTVVSGLLADHDEQRVRPRAMITFDDAYAGAVTAGVEELRARRLPATIFVTPGFLDGKAFWWDVLADATTGLNPLIRERALTEGRGVCAEVLALASRLGLPVREMPSYARGASIDELNIALRYDQITLASHTWSHPNLTSLVDADLAEELAKSLQWLERFADRARPVISFPYGLTNRRVQQAVRDAGYKAAFMIDGGWTAARHKDAFAIPRLNIPAGVSRYGFELRTAGIIGA